MSFESLVDSRHFSKGTDMSKTKALKLLVAALFVIGATLAAFANPVEVRFAGLGGESQNGEYTYPYYLTIDNGPQIANDLRRLSITSPTWVTPGWLTSRISAAAI